MLGTSLVNIVVSIIKSGVDWLSLYLDWDVLSVGIDTIESISGIVPFALDIPHERCTITESVIITGTRASILSHDDRIFEFLGTFKTTRKIASNKLMLEESSALGRNNLVWHVLTIDCKLHVVVDRILEDGEIIVMLREHDGNTGGVGNWHVNSRLDTCRSSSNWECVIIELLGWNNHWSREKLGNLVKGTRSNAEAVHIGLKRANLHASAHKITGALSNIKLSNSIDTRSSFGELVNNLGGVAYLSKSMLEHRTHVLVADTGNGLTFHHLLEFFDIHRVHHAPDKSTWLHIELKFEVTADGVWIHVECLESKNVIEWEINFKFHWMWESVLEFGDVDISTADRWRIDTDIFVKGVNILPSLLFIAWLKG